MKKSGNLKRLVDILRRLRLGRFLTWSTCTDEECFKKNPLFVAVQCQCRQHYCGPTCYHGADRNAQNYSGARAHQVFNTALSGMCVRACVGVCRFILGNGKNYAVFS